MAENHHINVDFKNSEAKVKANIVLFSFKANLYTHICHTK